MVKNLSDNGFKYLLHEFGGELLELVGIYSCECMNNFKNLFDDRLVNKYGFYSSLRGECISDKDYLRAVNVWNIFDMKTVGDYLDLYLETDVILLAAVFEKFIGVCLEYNGLDPCYYLSSSGLS